MNRRETLSLELNVFENFSPILPERYRSSPFVLLGNIAPALQLHVLDQVQAPQFIIANTIDFWIETAREDFLKLLKRIDMLILNEHEAQLLTGAINLIRAGRLLRELGPRFVVINKGEHGSLLFGENAFFSCPAFPLEEVQDPTGAGDSFAGGLIGYLAHTGKSGPQITFEHLRSAVLYGTVLASFNLESFSMDRFQMLTHSEIEERLLAFRLMIQCNSAPAERVRPIVSASSPVQSSVVLSIS
ncbi:MAG: sugar kinase [Verrucomicrobia bacterium]|nr:MAG: sugar kinase [Verrucomicrobiota bacterium]